MVVGQRQDPVLAVARGSRAGAVLQWSGLVRSGARAARAFDLPAGVSASFGPIMNSAIWCRSC
jgi:hypothetical protein